MTARLDPLRSPSVSVILLVAALAGCSEARGLLSSASSAETMPLDDQAQYLADRKAEAAALPDAPTALPKGTSSATELQYMIQLGEAIIRQTNTHPLTAPYIPNSGLTCSSCHLQEGKKKALASTFIGTAAAFPAFNARDKSVVTLQDRINVCFMRSMNGVRLPADSEAMLAMTAYITWLSQGFPIRMNPDRAVASVNGAYPSQRIAALVQAGKVDATRGAALYAARCAQCHGADGNGVGASPPVWGPRSYNKGAGNSNVTEGATWVQFNMPPAAEFTLPDQDAADMMAYVNAQPRPAFVENDHLPASGARCNGPEFVYHYGRSFTAATFATRAPVIVDQGPTGTDGASLYAASCAGCHGSLASSTEKGRTAEQIQSAIANVAAMKPLAGMGADEIAAIAAALAQ